MISPSNQDCALGSSNGEAGLVAVTPAAQYAQLMAENEVLGLKPVSRLHQRRQPMQQQFAHPQHAAG